MSAPTDAAAVARALRAGVATLDALAARLDQPARDELLWALDDAVARGWVTSSIADDCGPNGLCGASAPVVYSATDAGRAVTRRPG